LEWKLSKKTIEIEGTDYYLEELTTAKDIAMRRSDEDNVLLLLKESIIKPELTMDEIKKMPTRISNKLIGIINKLNGWARGDDFLQEGSDKPDK